MEEYDMQSPEDMDAPVDLTEFDDEYEDIEPAEPPDFEPVPDGHYQCKVDKAYVARAKSSGNPMLKWELLIVSGAHKGRRLFRNNMLQTRDNIRWLKHDLAVVGVKIGKTSELHSRLEDLLDVALEVSVRNRTEGDQNYSNVYFNKRLNIDLPPESHSGGGGGDLEVF